MDSIRWKMFLYFCFSILLTLLTVIALWIIAMIIYENRMDPFYSIISYVFHLPIIGILFLLLLAGMFFMLYFFVLTSSLMKYLLRIIHSVNVISSGNLDHRIPITRNDELGLLANQINTMTEKLDKSMEEERKAAKAKQELITSVSHDLRTPLTSIVGYMDLIERDQYKDEVELRHYTNIVFSKAKRLQKLIEDLFEYTRTLHGTMIIKEEKVDVGQLLEQLVAEAFPMLDKAGVQCRLHPFPEKIIVTADGDKLARVYENLISNAIQYGQKGKYVDIKWKLEKQEAVVEIINYGQPIAAQDLPFVFERFYRGEKSRADHLGGAGLGLAIAKNIIELHGGTVTARSTTDQTVFETRLTIN
ncbi:signal transduction histidine kinase [Evansella vedderi]|uniref:histidine kinase n=1 Tax=Evansella vedderi TaxID=38282 RepID=A0ABU0A0Q0_9BACI|nr:signal transduction histidine kinase [Evansella vedderi]